MPHPVGVGGPSPPQVRDSIAGQVAEMLSSTDLVGRVAGIWRCYSSPPRIRRRSWNPRVSERAGAVGLRMGPAAFPR